MKHQNFDTKIFYKDKVYLPASDCALALGYESIERFINENADMITTINDIPRLISEEDYNSLLIKRPEAFEVQHSIEIRKVTTLNAKITSFLDAYAFKMALGGSTFETKAREKNCETVEEYIERYDYPAEAARILKDIKKKKKNFEDYDSQVEFVTDSRIFVPRKLDDCGVMLQFMTEVKKDRLELYAFFAGDGLFYEIPVPYHYDKDEYLYMDDSITDTDYDKMFVWYGDEIYERMTTDEEGSLIIPVNEEGEGIIPKNIGKTTKKRDFRKYNVFENIIWVLQNVKSARRYADGIRYTAEGIDLYIYESMIVNLLLQDDPETVLVEGIVEYDIKNKITNIKNLPVFHFEVADKK